MKTLSALLGCAIFMFVHTKTVFARATLPSHHLRCEEGTEFWDTAMERCHSCHTYCRDHAISGVTEYCDEKCPDYMKAGRCDPMTEFWDTAMEKCQSCDSYCSHHAAMGMTEDCERKCPDYMKARQCDEGYFFDSKLEACAPCSSLCAGRENTEEECRRPCPRYRLNIIVPEPSVPQDTQKTSDATPDQSNANAALTTSTPAFPSAGESQPKSAGVSWPVHRTVVIVVFILAVAVAAAVAVLYKRGKLSPPRAVDGGGCAHKCPAKFPEKEVEDVLLTSQTKLLPSGGVSCHDLSGVTQGEMYHPGPHCQPANA